MRDEERYTLFSSGRKLAHGDLLTVALAAHAVQDLDIFVFADLTGRPMDLDLHGSATDVATRYTTLAEPSVTKVARGRPKLGVIPREVTLLPRHWDWLAMQPGGASAALRRLVEQARRDAGDSERRRQAQEAAHRVMTAIAGDLPNYEDALRALYGGDEERFATIVGSWPADIGDYILFHTRAAWASEA